MATVNPGPVPELHAVIREPFKDWRLPRVWIDWLNALLYRVLNAIRVIRVVELTEQAASIVDTSLIGVLDRSALYRITWYLRISQAATVSSSVTVAFAWADHAVAQTLSGAAVVGNTTDSYQTGSATVYADVLTELTYAVTRVSVGVTPAQFQLSIVIEAVQP